MKRSLMMVALVPCITSALFSCSKSDGGGTPDEATGGSGSTVVSCLDDPRVDAPAPLVKPGVLANMQFELVLSDPSPPFKGDNRMVVRATNPDGSPVTGTLHVELTMPDHGHSASTLPDPVLDPETASYTLEPLTLFMAGVWKLDLRMKSDATGDLSSADSVSFFFCVEG